MRIKLCYIAWKETKVSLPRSRHHDILDLSSSSKAALREKLSDMPDDY